MLSVGELQARQSVEPGTAERVSATARPQPEADQPCHPDPGEEGHVHRRGEALRNSAGTHRQEGSGQTDARLSQPLRAGRRGVWFPSKNDQQYTELDRVRSGQRWRPRRLHDLPEPGRLHQRKHLHRISAVRQAGLLLSSLPNPTNHPAVHPACPLCSLVDQKKEALIVFNKNLYFLVGCSFL